MAWSGSIMCGFGTATLFVSGVRTQPGQIVVQWDFANAYPVKWSAPQFSADGKNAAVESLELAHDGLIPGGKS